MLVSDRVVEPFLEPGAPFLHGLTFGGHPVSCAVALANLDLFEREDLLGHVRAHEAELGVGAPRAAPTCRSWATSAARATSGPSSWSGTRPPRRVRRRGVRLAAARRAVAELFEAGLICRADDRAEPMIVVAPPLIAGPEEISFIEATLRSVLDEAWRRTSDDAERRKREDGAMLTVGVPKGDQDRGGPGGDDARRRPGARRHGVQVFVEQRAGVGAAIDDAEFAAAGAEIVRRRARRVAQQPVS